MSIEGAVSNQAVETIDDDGQEPIERMKSIPTKRSHGRACAALLACAAFLVSPEARAQIQFEPAQIADWRNHAFKGRTDYRLVQTDRGSAIEASCSASASGLFLERVIDLRETPIIEWTWRVDESAPGAADERSRAGDDFAARIYVVKDGGLLRWRTRAINYVWARTAARGDDWPNPYADQARMVAVRSAAEVGGWRTERRDVREDFLRYHGLDVETIDAVAIMTDCDDGGGNASARYGAIRFLPPE